MSLQGDLLVVGAGEDSNSTSIGSTASSDNSHSGNGAAYVGLAEKITISNTAGR